MNLIAAALVLALMLPVPAPGPSASANPGQLKTIVTVRSNPFCTSLVTHFNRAVQPMVANDATLDQVDTQLVDLKAIFASPDYVQRFYKFRTKLGLFVDQMQKRLPPMQQHINQLRDGEKLADDPADAKRIHALAEKMQLAYNKQMQLVTDLYGIVQGSMDYKPLDAPHPLAGQDPEELARPADEKDLKSYLRFDGQRDVISQSEEAAGDIAYDVATTRCQ